MKIAVFYIRTFKSIYICRRHIFGIAINIK